MPTNEAIIAIGLAHALAGDIRRRTMCTGSYSALRCRSLRIGVAPSEADGSMPSEPVSIAAMSDSMSPNRLSVTITSNCFGQRTSCMPPASASCAQLDILEFALREPASRPPSRARPSS
jgi:hypothetical protein